MKKLILMLMVSITVLFTSCMDVGETIDYDKVILKCGNKEYKVKYVIVSDGGGGIYVIYPKDSTLTVPVQTNFKQGKTNTAVVQLD